MAGLAAALQAKRAGLEVLVLESRDRPGGRLETRNYGSLYAESGAMVVTDDEPETLELLRQFGLGSLVALGEHGIELFLWGRHARLTRLDGRVERLADWLSLYRFLLASLRGRAKGEPLPSLALLRGLRRAVEQIRVEAERVAFPYVPDEHPGWDTRSFAAFLSDFHPGLIPYFDLQLKVTAGDLAERISMFWGMVTFHWNVNSHFYWIRGGSRALPEAMAAELGDSLVLGAEVTEIRAPGQPIVRYRLGTTSAEVRPRAVIVATTPSRALAAMKDLDSRKRSALSKVPFGAYIPVHLLCRRRFWSDRIRTGYMNCAGLVFADLADGTREQPGEQGVLIAFIAGPEAKRLVDAPEGEIITEVRRDLERVFPGCWPEVLRSEVFRWPEGIPYFPENYGPILRDLREPWGSVFFCGDYTQGAGINDAVISGQLAAGQVVARLRSGG